MPEEKPLTPAGHKKLRAEEDKEMEAKRKENDKFVAQMAADSEARKAALVGLGMSKKDAALFG